MPYIRKTSEELTGIQCHGGYDERLDIGCDFIMNYGIGGDAQEITERIKSWKKAGYTVHLMTGIAWGGYRKYLEGEWDCVNHWDEAQTDRFGNKILHNPDRPYMVPSVTFADYMTERLKIAVDAGVEAIHVEEPEFFDRGGYSEAFKREYHMYYGKEWTEPYKSIDTMYKCAKLKAYLYKRTIDRVSSSIKNYAHTKYDRSVRFYVPTHSLLNYIQWKISSPEASLTDVPGVDGYIAQIWTGTSREENMFEGKIAERTFETSYLEYGVMQELVSGTGRQMWFLHDPIEDQPCYDWEDYRKNYLKTVTASLLHTRINTFEVCPWPMRFLDKGHMYPSNSPDAKPISDEYKSILNGNFQMLGDIPKTDDNEYMKTGVLISDTALYQRNYPDGFISEPPDGRIGTVLRDTDEDRKQFNDILLKGGYNDDVRCRFERSSMLPSFYGLTLPLLKNGLGVKPVLLDNVRRFNGYLDKYKVLVLSYEFIKPEFPDVNAALCAWVNNGGTLIYIGDGFDPYHKIESFWSGKFENPAEHLFDLLGVENPEKNEYSIYKVGKGIVTVWNYAPCSICISKENADKYKSVFEKTIEKAGFKWNKKNYLIKKRGPYVSAAVLDETDNKEPLRLDGLYADMYAPEFDIVENPVLYPGDNHTYFDLGEIKNESLRIIGTSARVFGIENDNNTVKVELHSAADTKVYTRIKVPFRVKLSDNDCDLTAEYDEKSSTVLIKGERYGSLGKNRVLELVKNE